MQLDDVVKTTVTGPRVEEAMYRTTRWLDRCIEAHARNDEQSIFPIVQGGLDTGKYILMIVIKRKLYYKNKNYTNEIFKHVTYKIYK